MSNSVKEKGYDKKNPRLINSLDSMLEPSEAKRNEAM